MLGVFPKAKNKCFVVSALCTQASLSAYPRRTFVALVSTWRCLKTATAKLTDHGPSRGTPEPAADTDHESYVSSMMLDREASKDIGAEMSVTQTLSRAHTTIII